MSAEIINNRAKDGDERESKRLRKAKAKALEVKSETVNKTTVGPFLDGEDIGHLLLAENFTPPRPYDRLEELFPDIPDDYVLTRTIVGLAGFVVVLIQDSVVSF
ncbi:hypothetical protein CASFOL_039498 [Castilleja foliolosa]|uniref:Uncharacterized protein n=1 Tax=Castilleja foliolosa TaxID=1961234 RepID=A0ABD3BIT2_9LAMI